MHKLYVIGSMKNPDIPDIAKALRADGHEVFEDWFSPGPNTDDHWMEYERRRGRSYGEALQGAHAQHVFDFDFKWLNWADTVVLVLPAGKSAHLEAGWAIGAGKQAYALFTEEPERFDIMYQLLSGVFFDLKELRVGLGEDDGLLDERRYSRSEVPVDNDSREAGEFAPLSVSGSWDYPIRELNG